ncbi:MAG TPA: flagellar biosynthesis protein FliQ [Clostridiales bacterium]|nr:flagellar biosynthesis protein FliQ [Clostridiales bacterium]
MNEQIIIDIVRQALWIVIKVSFPILIVSMVIGLIISVLQTVTSIQEQTLTFVPKLIGIFLVIMISGNWIMTEVRNFAMELYSNFGYYIDLL